MLPPNQGRLSFIVALASCVLLFLVSKIVTNRNNPIKVQVAPGGTAVQTAFFEHEVETSLVKIATPFGHNAAHHLTHPRRNQSSRPRRPFPRVKRDVTLTWAEAVANGQSQLDRLSGTKTESQYLLLSDMESPAGTPLGTGNGWSVSEQPNPQAPPDFIDAFIELDIPLGSANHYRLSLQDTPFKNCWHTDLPATSARFANYINIKGKTMVADVSYSPTAMMNEQDIVPEDWKERLPNVKLMSDVTWIQWVTVAEAEGTPSAISDLKYIFRHEVITENTRFIIEQAAKVEEDEFNADWPGLKFVTTDTEFLALLGTVHGVFNVHLLVSHPNELGTKAVEAVNIFTTDGGDNYHMLWTLTGNANSPIDSAG